MSDRYTAGPRRIVRRRRRSFLSSVSQSWLGLLLINPRRAPLHLLVLGVGLAALPLGGLVNERGTTPTTDSPRSVEAAAASLDAAAPEAAQAAVSEPTQVMQAAPDVRTYIVESGDTLKVLADRFGVSVATIAAANKLTDPDSISIGQELIMPPTTGLLVSVSAAETLGQLATRYGADLVQLASVNQVEPRADVAVVGEKVVVPGIEPKIAERPKVPQAVAASSPSGPQQTAQGSEPKQDGDGGQPRTRLASLTVGEEEAERLLGEGGEANQNAVVETPEKPVAKVQPPVVYEVQDGDNVRSLANQFGVSVRTILLANDLDDPDMISVGTKLKVLPVSGVEHEVAPGESLADIAAAYKVDMGPIVDFNGLGNPDKIAIGDKVMIPGATTKILTTAPVAQEPAAPAVAAAAPATKPGAPAAAAVKPAAADKPAVQAATKPAVQAAVKPVAPAVAPSIAVPAPVSSGRGGGSVLQNAMNYVGHRYVFGGSSPAGFDCSGFVWYVHKAAGLNISRGLWGQLNGGPRIPRDSLQPGDTVFFANTYMPGLSHVGIYVGGGRFVHAISEGKGVGVSSMSDAYWSGRYVGAARLY
jgi:cell wall-associated NlpC family hydrolase